MSEITFYALRYRVLSLAMRPNADVQGQKYYDGDKRHEMPIQRWQSLEKEPLTKIQECTCTQQNVQTPTTSLTIPFTHTPVP